MSVQEKGQDERIAQKVSLKVRRNITLYGFSAAVTLMAAACIYPFCVAYKSEVAMQRSILQERAQTILKALTAGIMAHGRMGRYHTDRLAVIFEELAKDPNILALQLRNPSGTLVVSAGDPGKLPNSLPDSPLWLEKTVVATSLLNLQETCDTSSDNRGRMGMGRQGLDDWKPFETGAYRLCASLDASGFSRAIHNSRIHLAFSLAVTLAALGLGGLAFLLLFKRSELATELQRQREKARRHEQVARLGAGLAHETKNPLGIVRGLAQSIAKCPNGCCNSTCCPVKNRANDIVDEVDRVIGGINSFLELSRTPEAKQMPIRLDALFAGFLQLAQMDAAAAEVDISYAPCGLSVMADETLLRRALLNLILNALRASKPGQSILVRAERSGTSLSLAVADQGCGISPEDLPRVTEPYYTRFPGGSGLGLPIVEQIAVAHGWTLLIESVQNQGTRVSLEGLSIVEQS